MTATVEQIAEVLREHRDVCGDGSLCDCGWQRPLRPGAATPGPGAWLRHTAEQVAALGVRAGDPRDVAHIECDCVPDLGPAHCHLCSVRAGREMPWAEAHPSEVEWAVRWQGKVYPMSEADALAQVRVRPSTRSLVQRAVGPWVEVTDEGGEGA